jgi:hypothetical protein
MNISNITQAANVSQATADSIVNDVRENKTQEKMDFLEKCKVSRSTAAKEVRDDFITQVELEAAPKAFKLKGKPFKKNFSERGPKEVGSKTGDILNYTRYDLVNTEKGYVVMVQSEAGKWKEGTATDLTAREAAAWLYDQATGAIKVTFAWPVVVANGDKFNVVDEVIEFFGDKLIYKDVTVDAATDSALEAAFEQALAYIG